MPEISLFYGIRITMNYSEHNPPHFHARYGDNECSVSIQDHSVMKGYFPRKQMHLILAWAAIHEGELMQNWELSKDGKPMSRINPLL